MGNSSKLHSGIELRVAEFRKCLLQFSSELCKVQFTTVTSWMRWTFSLVFDWVESTGAKQWYMRLQTPPRTHIVHDERKWICTLQKSDQYINFCRKHSSTFPSTCSRNALNFNHIFHKNYENSYFYHNSTVPRVTASTPQHCMDTKEKVLHSTCLFASPYFPSTSYCISLIIRHHQLYDAAFVSQWVFRNKSALNCKMHPWFGNRFFLV